MKKTVSISNHILVEVYGEHALTKRMCQAWFARFESGNFNLEDEEMETSLDEDSSQTQEEVAETLEVNHQAISHCLKIKIMDGLVPIQARDYTPVPIPPPRKVFLHRISLHYFNMKKDVVYSNQKFQVNERVISGLKSLKKGILNWWKDMSDHQKSLKMKN